MKRKDIDLLKEEIIEKLKNNVPRAEICRWLNCRYYTLKTRIDKWGYSHLKNPQRKGYLHSEQHKDILPLLKKDSVLNSNNLRLRLIRQGIKESKCEICLNTEWKNKPIPLELDHINGDRYDNRLDNLRILCPNCHAQTPTYCSKNRLKVNNASLPQLAEGVDSNSIKSGFNSPEKHQNKKHYCSCGNKLSSLRNKQCLKCFNLCRATKIDWPPIHELHKKVLETNFSTVAKELNVSDNAIRKRLKTYGILCS